MLKKLMELKNKIYIINGNDILFALLNEESDRWYTEIKLLKNLDKALNYISNQINLYFRLFEPSSSAVILIDKPIRDTSRYSKIKIKFISHFDFLEELKFEIKTYAGKADIYLVADHNYLDQIPFLNDSQYINSRDFFRNVSREEYFEAKEDIRVFSQIAPRENILSDSDRRPIFESFNDPKTQVIEKLRKPNLNLNVDDINIEIDLIKDSILALHFVGKSFPLNSAVQYVNVRPIIYIGYTSKGDALRSLLSDDSSRSNVRKLIGAILRDKELKKYEIINISDTEFKFDLKTEWKITDWIKDNISVSLFRNVKDLIEPSLYGHYSSQLKNEIIRELSPVLNLSNNPGNTYVFELKQLLNKTRELGITNYSRSESEFIIDSILDRKNELKNYLMRLNNMLRDFDRSDLYAQREIISLIMNYSNLKNIFQYYYSNESKTKERDLLDFISEKEEKTVKQEWERIIDEMAHSINTDVYAALSYLNQFLDNEKIKKAFYNIQQIRDLTNLIMWFLKRNKLKLSGLLESVSLDDVIRNQIDTIKAGINTLRLTTSGHRDKISNLSVDVEKHGRAVIKIDKDLVSAIDLLFKDILRNALKNTDENGPMVHILLKEDNDFILVDISNNLIISEKELDWFNSDIEDDELQMSKSSKVGLRIIKKWCTYLKIKYRIETDIKRKETIFHLKIPKEVNVEESN